MSFLENIKLALRSVRTNLLRSVLTMFIIAIGIACLVGILTAIDTILFSMSSNFSRLGANSFGIYPSSENLKSSKSGKRSKTAPPIVFDQAINFKEKYDYSGSKVSLRLWCLRSATVKFNNQETNPTVTVEGVDENYFEVSAFDIEEGRNFNRTEINYGSNVVVIGSEILKTLFNENPSFALGKKINIDNNKFEVIGVLKPKGNSGSSSNDRRVYIPIIKAKNLYGSTRTNYSINVAIANAMGMEEAMSYATGVLRNVRGLRASEPNDFDMFSSGSILETLNDLTDKIQIGALAIALMTLLGAAIGLMNIMLVSVTERTREIGIRKSLGATSNNILIQFLTEAITICQIGGIIGIFLGMLMGVIVTTLIKGNFVMPWAWMILAIIVCLFVGVLSGLYPALKASRLDPIESLRYE